MLCPNFPPLWKFAPFCCFFLAVHSMSVHILIKSKRVICSCHSFLVWVLINSYTASPLILLMWFFLFIFLFVYVNCVVTVLQSLGYAPVTWKHAVRERSSGFHYHYKYQRQLKVKTSISLPLDFVLPFFRPRNDSWIKISHVSDYVCE